MGDFRSLVSNLVLDHGSGVVRCGYGNENKPLAVVPSVVGYKTGSVPVKNSQSGDRSPRVAKKSSVSRPQVLPPVFVPPPTTKVAQEAVKSYAPAPANVKIGHEAFKLRSFFDLEYPIDETGMVVNFDALEQMWKLIYKNVLKGSFFLSNLAMSFPFTNDASTFETAAEILFEKYNVPKLILSRDADMAVRFFGLQTGLLVDMGHNSIRCIPVFGRKCHFGNIHQIPFGANKLIECLANLMSQKGYKLHPQADSELLHSLLKDCCYVADDFESELSSVEATLPSNTYSEKSAQLTSYDVIKNDMDVERIQIPEMLFQPGLFYGRNGGKRGYPTIDEVILQALQSNALLTEHSSKVTIALCGGQSAIPNLAQRLQDTLIANNPQVEASIWDVRCLNGSPDASWVAASKLVGQEGPAERFWVRKKEFEDHGSSILRKKWL